MRTLTIHQKINIRADRMKKGIGHLPQWKPLDCARYGQYVYGGQGIYQIREAKR